MKLLHTVQKTKQKILEDNTTKLCDNKLQLCFY